MLKAKIPAGNTQPWNNLPRNVTSPPVRLVRAARPNGWHVHGEEQPAFTGSAQSIMSFPFTASVVVVIIVKCNKFRGVHVQESAIFVMKLKVVLSYIKLRKIYNCTVGLFPLLCGIFIFLNESYCTTLLYASGRISFGRLYLPYPTADSVVTGTKAGNGDDVEGTTLPVLLTKCTRVLKRAGWEHNDVSGNTRDENSNETTWWLPSVIKLTQNCSGLIIPQIFHIQAFVPVGFLCIYKYLMGRSVPPEQQRLPRQEPQGASSPFLKFRYLGKSHVQGPPQAAVSPETSRSSGDLGFGIPVTETDSGNIRATVHKREKEKWSFAVPTANFSGSSICLGLFATCWLRNVMVKTPLLSLNSGFFAPLFD